MSKLRDNPRFQICARIILLTIGLYLIQFLVCPRIYERQLYGWFDFGLWGGNLLAAFVGMAVIFHRTKRWRLPDVGYAVLVWLLADLVYFLLILVYHDAVFEIRRFSDADTVYQVAEFVYAQILAAVCTTFVYVIFIRNKDGLLDDFVHKKGIAFRIIALVAALYFAQFVISPLFDHIETLGTALIWGGDPAVALLGMWILFKGFERWRFADVVYAVLLWLTADLLYFLLVFMHNDRRELFNWPLALVYLCLFALFQILALFVTIIARSIKKRYLRMKQNG